jgi:hypothetical protein
MSPHRLENRVESHSTGGRSQIPERTGDNGKFVLRQPALLCKEGNKARIGLMGCQTLQGGPSDTAAEFDVLDHLFQSRDGRARERFAIEMHVEVPVRRIRYANRSRVLPRTAEEKFPEGISLLRRGTVFRSQEKRAGAIAKKPAKFARHESRPERAAMNVGSDDGDGAGLSRGNESLGDSKPVYKAEARAADIQRAARFASEELGVELRR